MKKECAITSYVGMVICIIMGLYKMFVYENPESILLESKNVYVGGDAYNYIINANYSTSWFVLGGVCAIIGLTFVVAGYLDKNITVQEGEVSENGEINE